MKNLRGIPALVPVTVILFTAPFSRYASKGIDIVTFTAVVRCFRITGAPPLMDTLTSRWRPFMTAQ